MRTSYKDNLACGSLPFRHRHRYQCNNGHRLKWSQIQHWQQWIWCPDCGSWRDWTATPILRSCFCDASLSVGSASEMLVYGFRSAWAYIQVSQMRDRYLANGDYDEREFKRLGYTEMYLAALDDTDIWFTAVDGGNPGPFVPANSPREAYELTMQSILELRA